MKTPALTRCSGYRKATLVFGTFIAIQQHGCTAFLPASGSLGGTQRSVDCRTNGACTVTMKFHPAHWGGEAWSGSEHDKQGSTELHASASSPYISAPRTVLPTVLSTTLSSLDTSSAKTASRSAKENRQKWIKAREYVKESPVRLADFTPAQRIVIMARGTLTGIISAYYDDEVRIDVMRNVEIGDGVYDREVHMSVCGADFCVATSTVTLHTSRCRAAIESRAIGIGQLFKHFKIQPELTLHSAGHLANGGLWRDYTLTSKHMTCRIHETFPCNPFELIAQGGFMEC